MNAAALRLVRFARLEPTTDHLTLPSENRKDVVIYSDQAGTEFVGRFPWWHKALPDRRYRYITLNCYRYRLLWLPEIDRGSAD